MSEKKDTKPNLSAFLKEFSAGIALKFWLFFLFCFYFLGYSIPLSILLGAAGGLAAGWVVGWWKTKDDPNDLKLAAVDDSEELDEGLAKVSGLRLAKRQRDAKINKRSKGFLTPFSKFFKRGNSARLRRR
jgi:hypothetical protein